MHLKAPPHLQLVKPPLPIVEEPIGTQLQLPLQPSRLFIVDMTIATKHSFVTFVSQERPIMLFDVRHVPSFGLDAFSRKAAFRLFEQHGINYFDLGAILGINTLADSSVGSGRVAERISEIFANMRIEPDKIGILLDGSHAQLWAERQLHEAIRPRPKAGWKLELIPRPRLAAVR